MTMADFEDDAPMTEQRAKRWLSEAEGCAMLELYDRALEKALPVTRTTFLPLESNLLAGELYREQAQHAKALPHFARALKEKPGGVEATVGFGWCLKRTGRLPEAVQAYETALKLHPNEALLHYNLACYQSLLGKVPEAFAALDRALAIDETFRRLALDETDFDPVRNLPDFQKRVPGVTRSKESASSSPTLPAAE